MCLLSSGSCTAALGDAPGALPSLPPKEVEAGGLILSRSPLQLTPAGESHILCLLLTGSAPAQLLAGLPIQPFPARGESCPGAAELMDRLAGGGVQRQPGPQPDGVCLAVRTGQRRQRRPAPAAPGCRGH